VKREYEAQKQMKLPVFYVELVKELVQQDVYMSQILLRHKKINV
jgi:hypothetical protein